MTETQFDFDTAPRVIAVVGSRDFPKLGWVHEFVRRTKPNTIIVSGGARGVDAAAKEAADTLGRLYKPYHVEDFEWELGNDVALFRNECVVRYCAKYKGHVVIFALVDERTGVMTGGSNNVVQHCLTHRVPYTIYKVLGKVEKKYGKKRRV